MITTPLIIALDFATADHALHFVKQLNPKKVALKIGLQLFTTAGPHLIETLQQLGFGIFLDLKFHDIPNTVKSACLAAASLGVDMLTLHAENGSACIAATVEAMKALQHPPKLIAVTVLTSMTEAALQEQGHAHSLSALVLKRAQLAIQAGADGVVASPLETALLRKTFGAAPVIVTPGIRMPDDPLNDQSRVATPATAMAAGSSFIVVGRPITEALDPPAVIDAILNSLLK